MKWIRPVVYLALAILGLLLQIFPWLELPAAVVCAVAMAVSLPYTSRGSRILVIFLMSVSCLFMLSHGAGLSLWAKALTDMLDVVVVVSFVPLLTLGVTEGESLNVLGDFLGTHVKSMWGCYAVIAIAAFVVGSLILVTTIPLLWVISSAALSRLMKDPDRLLVISIPRGYSAALVWAPAAPTVAVCLAASQAQWLDVLPYAIGVSFVYLALALLSGYQRFKEEKADLSYSDARLSPGNESLIAARRKALIQMMFFLVAFVVSVALLTGPYGFNYYVVVPLAALCITLLWLVVLKRTRRIPMLLLGFAKNTLPGIGSQVALLLTAGFFGTAMSLTPIEGWIGSLLAFFCGRGVLVIIAALVVLIVGGAVIGIHPFITIVVVGKSLETLESVLPITVVALTLLSASSIGFLISPLSATALVTSAMAHLSSFVVGPRNNLVYGIIASFLMVAIVYAVSQWMA
ncbi:MAG TPA: hypothetical protein PL027_02620 [Thermosynergistes sp.]|nr:hypothetical protein [Thermosynergistes sp.]